MKNTNQISALEIQFNNECKYINLRKEYPEFVGNEKWAIVSDLPEKEIREKYAVIIERFRPFLCLTFEQAKPIVQFHSNNRKHIRRNTNFGDAYGYDDTLFEKFHPELVFDPYQQQDWEFLNNAIDKLPEAQNRRIRKRFFQEMNNVEIAKEEGVSSQAVDLSIKSAIENLKSILADLGFYPSKNPNQ